MNAEFYDALELLQQEKGIPKSYMYDKIKAAIAATIKTTKKRILIFSDIKNPVEIRNCF